MGVIGVMCENANYALPSTQDVAEWADYIDVTFPALADASGEVCATYAYEVGVTTVFVLDTGRMVSGTYDSTDADVLDTIRAGVEALLP